MSQKPGAETRKALEQGLFAEMRKNLNVTGVKNSSMPVQDIQMFMQAAGFTKCVQHMEICMRSSKQF